MNEPELFDPEQLSQDIYAYMFTPPPTQEPNEDDDDAPRP